MGAANLQHTGAWHGEDMNTKTALKTLWKDKLTVSEYQKYTKPNGATAFHEVDILTNEPCKLSFTTLNSNGQNETESHLTQVAKLFLDNDIEIKPGSKITIYRNNLSYGVFQRSGLPGIFSSHQEIILVQWVRWA